MNACTIRTLRPDDEHRLLQFERDNRRWFEAHIDPRGDDFYTRDGVRAHIEQYLDGYARATWHPCVIVDRSEAIVGQANLKEIDLAKGMAEIGYRVAQRTAGQGLATQAVRYLTTLARTEWRLNQLFAHVSTQNTASARVLEKCGFVRAACLPNRALLHGVPAEGHLFSCQLSECGCAVGASLRLSAPVCACLRRFTVLAPLAFPPGLGPANPARVRSGKLTLLNFSASF